MNKRKMWSWFTTVKGWAKVPNQCPYISTVRLNCKQSFCKSTSDSILKHVYVFNSSNATGEATSIGAAAPFSPRRPTALLLPSRYWSLASTLSL